MSINFEEQLIKLPWMINSYPDKSFTFLVSAPDGKIVELAVSETIAQQLPDIFDRSDFWETVFTSLVKSLEQNDQTGSAETVPGRQPS